MKIETFTRAKMLLTEEYFNGNVGIASDLEYTDNILAIKVDDKKGNEHTSPTDARLKLYNVENIINKYNRIKPYYKRNKIEFKNHWWIKGVKISKELESKLKYHNKLIMSQLKTLNLYAGKYDTTAMIIQIRGLNLMDTCYKEVEIINTAYQKLLEYEALGVCGK